MEMQCVWLLLCLSVLYLFGSSGSASSNGESGMGNCPKDAQQYDLCNDGRGYCDYPGQGVGRLKCYDGWECGAFPGDGHGFFVLTDPSDDVLGATAELICCTGYHVNGSSNITCGLNSTWAIPFGTCEANDCGATPLVTNGSYATPFGTTYPAVGYLTCGTGYVLTYVSLEDAFLRCDENGTWVPGNATCEPVDCGDPPTLPYGQFNVSCGTDYLSVGYLVCDEFFFPGNNSLITIVCNESGHWTDPQTACFTAAKDCTDLQAQGATSSGVYTVTINGSAVDVLCQLDDGGSMWTVIQQRVDGSQTFYLGWDDYEQGFGDLNSNFWLGLSNIYNIVGTGTTYRVKFYITDIVGNRTATYQLFSIADSADKYRLTISGYSGDTGDGMFFQDNRQFTTFDSDNDNHGSNCAVLYLGGWWYNNCHYVNLNGDWNNTLYGQGINWRQTTGYYRSATYTRIQVQPVP